MTTKLENLSQTAILFYTARYYDHLCKGHVKPPVGVPGKDDFCIDSVCKKCNRHFLIADEIKDHSMVCVN